MALEADEDFAFSDDDQNEADNTASTDSETGAETSAADWPADAPDAALEAGLDSGGFGGFGGNGVGGDDGDDGDGDEGAGEGEPEQPSDGRNWFVIHCYSGYENKVRHNLEQRIDSMGMKGKIFDVVVPTEEEIEVKDGKRRTVERRVFPGYLLVQMIMSEDSWYVVRNTPGVTGFVGMGNVPTPLRPEEVAQILRRMEAEAPKVKVTFKPGQKVRIVDGPFNDFIGTVAEIDMDRAKVRVMVSFFGRETPVELDFLQVEKV
jgi:transcriptional antiterminator NusG